MKDFLSKLKATGESIIGSLPVDDLGDKLKSITNKNDENLTEEEKEAIRQRKAQAKIEKEEQDIVKMITKIPSDKLEKAILAANEELQNQIAMGPVVEALKDSYTVQYVSSDAGVLVYKVKRTSKGTLFGYLFAAKEITDETKAKMTELVEASKEMQEVEHIIIDLTALAFVTDHLDAIALNKDLQKGKEAYDERVTIEEKAITLIVKTEKPEEPAAPAEAPEA